MELVWPLITSIIHRSGWEISSQSCSLSFRMYGMLISCDNFRDCSSLIKCFELILNDFFFINPLSRYFNWFFLHRLITWAKIGSPPNSTCSSDHSLIWNTLNWHCSWRLLASVVSNLLQRCLVCAKHLWFRNVASLN